MDADFHKTLRTELYQEPPGPPSARPGQAVQPYKAGGAPPPAPAQTTQSI